MVSVQAKKSGSCIHAIKAEIVFFWSVILTWEIRDASHIGNHCQEWPLACDATLQYFSSKIYGIFINIE